MYNINVPHPAQRNFSAPQPSMPRDQWTYTVFSAVFAICMVAVPYAVFAAYQAASSKNALKNIQEMWGVFVIAAGMSFFWGTLSGMIVGLLVEIAGRKRKFNPIVVAALAGGLWGGLTSFIVLIFPIIVSIIFVITIGAALPMILAIIVAVPFSSIYFALAMTCCRFAARRYRLKIYHVFLLAAVTAIIYSAIVPVLMLLYVLAKGFAK